jgi:hypothetical protein
MTYTLYYSPGSASQALHWMLIELGVPIEAKLVSIDAGSANWPPPTVACTAVSIEIREPAGSVSAAEPVGVRPDVEATAAGDAPAGGAVQRPHLLERIPEEGEIGDREPGLAGEGWGEGSPGAEQGVGDDRLGAHLPVFALPVTGEHLLQLVFTSGTTGSALAS